MDKCYSQRADRQTGERAGRQAGERALGGWLFDSTSNYALLSASTHRNVASGFATHSWWRRRFRSGRFLYHCFAGYWSYRAIGTCSRSSSSSNSCHCCDCHCPNLFRVCGWLLRHVTSAAIAIEIVFSNAILFLLILGLIVLIEGGIMMLRLQFQLDAQLRQVRRRFQCNRSRLNRSFCDYKQIRVEYEVCIYFNLCLS